MSNSVRITEVHRTLRRTRSVPISRIVLPQQNINNISLNGGVNISAYNTMRINIGHVRNGGRPARRSRSAPSSRIELSMQNRNNISLNRGVNMLSANNTRTAISNVGNGMRPSRRTRYASCSRLDLPMQNRTNISLNRSVNLVANKTRRTIDTNGMRLQYASGSENQRRLLQRLAVLNQRITEAEEYMRMLRRSASYLSHQVQVSLHRQNLVDIDYNRKGSNARLEVIIEVPSDEYSSVPPIKDLKACETNRERLAIRRSKQARRRLVFNTISMILVVFLPLMGIGFILYSYLNGLDPPIFTRNMVG